MRYAALALLLFGCASAPPPVGSTEPQLHPPDDRAVRRQLAGHLQRVRECLPIGRAGLVDVALVVLPDGSVGDARVTRDTSALRAVAPCMRQRMRSLRFDPPPSQAVRFRHRFTACAFGSDLACQLGPVVDDTGARVRPALEEAFRALHERRAECLAAHPDERAILEVELTVVDGKLTSGWVRRAEPATSPLRRCGVGPLLGAELAGVTDAKLVATLGLGLADVPSRSYDGRPPAGTQRAAR